MITCNSQIVHNLITKDPVTYGRASYMNLNPGVNYTIGYFMSSKVNL